MQPLKVLILDDEPIVGRHLKPALARFGLDVEAFDSPDQAIARMGETEFDVVVSDVRMKGIDGLKVLETVLSRSRRTKVIFITGYASKEVERAALVNGAFGFITKPFKPRDLYLAIKKAARALGRADREAPEDAEP